MKLVARRGFSFFLIAALFLPLNPPAAFALPNITATGTNPSVCNQTVSNTSGVTATRLAGGDCVIKFTTASTTINWTVPSGVQVIRFLVLGGGGGGGVDAGPGGSGGGAYEATGVAVTPGATIATYVAAGGTAGIYQGTNASPGETSTITIGATTFGGTGGSSGAYGSSTNPQPSAGSGGTGYGVGGTATSGALGGGGKGWTSSTGTGSVGNAGNLTTDITGTSTQYGGSGAGGANVNGVSVAIVSGGAGGGGAAGYNSPSNTIAATGSANTGGGGGAGMANVNPASFKSSGAGGTGLVVIRYTPDLAAPTITNASAPFSFAENTSTSTPSATVEISESSTIFLASTGDYLKFTITVVDTDTARIYFISSPDFENKLDLNADNDYELSLTLTDSSGNSGTASLTIRVTNVNEPINVGSITYSGTLYKGISATITVTSTSPSKTRFFADGKRIARCLAVTTTGSYPNYSASCSWIPTVSGRHVLTALVTPIDVALTAVTSAPTQAFVIKRTTTR